MLTKTVSILLLFAATLNAQYPASANTLLWQGTTTPQAGSFCWGFSCTPVPVTLMAGETGTLTIRGDYNMPYVIGLASTATRCLSIPGYYNQLVLDDPITIWWQGALTQPSPILSCPPGYQTITVTLPPSTPSGITFSMQALTATSNFSGMLGSFTTAFNVTVL